MTQAPQECDVEGCDAPTTINLTGRYTSCNYCGNEIHLCDLHAHETAHSILAQLFGGVTK